jgi:hypothetical protein
VEKHVSNGIEHAVVPIYRSNRDFWKDGANRHRNQFPVRVAYAITIHKAQGMTATKAVLNFNIGRKDLCLFYVAASRVRRLCDVIFEEAVDFDRISSGETAMRRSGQTDDPTPSRQQRGDFVLGTSP